MLYSLRLALFIVLFAILCVKGGELCAAGGSVFAETPAVSSSTEPQPIRPRSEEFRGLTPMPSGNSRLFSPLLDKR